MAKDAPNPDDFFGEAPSAPAPAAAKKARSVNPDDYFGATPAPTAPEPTVADRTSKALAEPGGSTEGSSLEDGARRWGSLENYSKQIEQHIAKYPKFGKELTLANQRRFDTERMLDDALSSLKEFRAARSSSVGVMPSSVCR